MEYCSRYLHLKVLEMKLFPPGLSRPPELEVSVSASSQSITSPSRSVRCGRPLAKTRMLIVWCLCICVATCYLWSTERGSRMAGRRLPSRFGNSHKHLAYTPTHSGAPGIDSRHSGATPTPLHGNTRPNASVAGNGRAMNAMQEVSNGRTQRVAKATTVLRSLRSSLAPQHRSSQPATWLVTCSR